MYFSSCLIIFFTLFNSKETPDSIIMSMTSKNKRNLKDIFSSRVTLNINMISNCSIGSGLKLLKEFYTQRCDVEFKRYGRRFLILWSRLG